MIGDRASRRRARFGDVETVHGGGATLRNPDLAAIGEVTGVAHRPGTRGQEIGLERQHDVGLREVEAHPDRRSEGLRRAPSSRRHGQRIPPVPARLRVALEQRGDQPRLGGRGHRAGQQSQARAAEGRLGIQRRGELLVQGRPGGGLAELRDRLRAVGVVKAQHRRLGDGVGRAEARGVLGIALDLRRAAVVTLDEQAGGDPGERHRGGEQDRLPGKKLLRLADIGHDLLDRLARAGGQSGEAQRGRGELQEVAPRDAVRPLRGEAGKLAIEQLAELGRLRQLLETPPVGGAAATLQALARRGEVDRHWRCGGLLPLDVAVARGRSSRRGRTGEGCGIRRSVMRDL